MWYSDDDVERVASDVETLLWEQDLAAMHMRGPVVARARRGSDG